MLKVLPKNRKNSQNIENGLALKCDLNCMKANIQLMKFELFRRKWFWPCLQKNRFSFASSSTIWLRFGSIKTRCAESINWWMFGIHQQAKGHTLLERPFMPNTYSKLINYFIAHDLVPFKNAQKSNEIFASCDFIWAQFFLLMKIKISFLTETDRSEEREKLLTAKEKSIQSEKNAKKIFGERERK